MYTGNDDFVPPNRLFTLFEFTFKRCSGASFDAGSEYHHLTQIKTRIIATRPAPQKRLIMMAPARSLSMMLINLLLTDLEGFSQIHLWLLIFKYDNESHV